MSGTLHSRNECPGPSRPHCFLPSCFCPFAAQPPTRTPHSAEGGVSTAFIRLGSRARTRGEEGKGHQARGRRRTRSQGRRPLALPGADRWPQGCTSGVLTRDALPSSPLPTHCPGHPETWARWLQRSRTQPAAQRQGQAVPEGFRKCGPAQALTLQVSV